MNRGAFRVVHLTSAHPPRDIRVFEKECRSLAAAGYEVTYIVPHDEDALIDGVRIHAVPRATSRRERMSRTAYRVLAAALELDADLYHFHDPELIPAGFALKARGKRVIYDVHENLPGDIVHSKSYLPRWVKLPLSTAARALEIVAGSAFDGIVTITDGFARRFPAEKTCVVSNYPLVSGRRDIGLPPHADRERLVVFIGGLATERCAREMVDGVAMAGAFSPVRLAVAGMLESTELLETLKAGPSGSAFDYLGKVSRASVEALLMRARVGLVINPLRPDYQDISTNKLYEYMLFGLPIVASPIPSWRSQVEEHRCGIVLSENTPEAVSEAVAWLLDHPHEAEAMGQRGAAAVHAKYNWSTEAAKLVSFYDRLLTPSG